MFQHLNVISLSLCAPTTPVVEIVYFCDWLFYGTLRFALSASEQQLSDIGQF